MSPVTFLGADEFFEALLAQDMEAQLMAQGKTLLDLPSPTGTEADVALGASLATYILEEIDSVAWAKDHLPVAMRYVCSGQWESTRWWPGRTGGVRSIGMAMLLLAQKDIAWVQGFLLTYFDVARRNGRHACWLHLACAVPALALLRPGMLSEIWTAIEPLEEWHQAITADWYARARQHEDLGRYATARHLYRCCLRHYSETEDQEGVANCLYGLSRVAYFQGHFGEARGYGEQSLELDQSLGNAKGVALSMCQLGLIAAATSDLGEARRLYQNSLTILERLGAEESSMVREELTKLSIGIGE